jgi:hypothetical protein
MIHLPFFTNFFKRSAPVRVQVKRSKGETRPKIPDDFLRRLAADALLSDQHLIASIQTAWMFGQDSMNRELLERDIQYLVRVVRLQREALDAQHSIPVVITDLVEPLNVEDEPETQPSAKLAAESIARPYPLE